LQSLAPQGLLRAADSLFIDIGQAHLRPFPGKPACRRKTDSPARTRDHRHSTLQTSHRAPSSKKMNVPAGGEAATPSPTGRGGLPSAVPIPDPDASRRRILTASPPDAPSPAAPAFRSEARRGGEESSTRWWLWQ